MTDPAVKACNDATKAINAFWTEMVKAIIATERKINEAWKEGMRNARP